MNLNHSKNLRKNSAYNNVVKTGYRALFLLMKLVESPKTRKELHDFFSSDPIINKDLSKDTITNTVNTLRVSGCLISRASQRTGYKYVLKSHPFLPVISKEGVNALQTVRSSIITHGDWELLQSLNNLYSKIAKFTESREDSDTLLYEHPLAKTDKALIQELLACIKMEKFVNVTYISPKYGTEGLYIMPEFLSFENDKLYVCGYCSKYKEISYFRTDRIKRVKFLDYSKFEKESGEVYKKPLSIKYELSGYSALMFTDNRFEKAVKKNQNSLIIQASVRNKFTFIQKLLSYGTDCKVISPDSFVDEFRETLKNIKRDYTNDGK